MTFNIKNIPLNKELTLNINDLETLSFNRNIRISHVNVIGDSVRRNGIQRKPIIACYNSKYYIIDGQHLIYFLRTMGVKDISCYVRDFKCEKEMVENMANLNNSACNWSVTNYVNAFSGLGNYAYKMLLTHATATGFSIKTSADILGDSSLIKTGEFKLSRDNADTVTNQILEISNLTSIHSSHFHQAVLSMIRNVGKYDHKHMLKQLSCKGFEVSDISTMRKKLIKLYKGC